MFGPQWPQDHGWVADGLKRMPNLEPTLIMLSPSVRPTRTLDDSTKTGAKYTHAIFIDRSVGLL